VPPDEPSPSPPLRVRRARSAADVKAARGLFQEYLRWLVEHREVTNFADSILERGVAEFEAEARALPGQYGPPGGALFLGFSGPLPIGCAGLRRLRRGIGEIKRVYVRPGFRGSGVGERLTRAALDEAGRLGYARAVLDTLPAMTAAIQLYRKMGFVPTERYWTHPVPDALFFEYRLGPTTARRATPARRPRPARARRRTSGGTRRIGARGRRQGPPRRQRESS
jgi:putative acetyltransferase